MPLRPTLVRTISARCDLRQRHVNAMTCAGIAFESYKENKPFTSSRTIVVTMAGDLNLCLLTDKFTLLSYPPQGPEPVVHKAFRACVLGGP